MTFFKEPGLKSHQLTWGMIMSQENIVLAETVTGVLFAPSEVPTTHRPVSCDAGSTSAAAAAAAAAWRPLRPTSEFLGRNTATITYQDYGRGLFLLGGVGGGGGLKEATHSFRLGPNRGDGSGTGGHRP